MGITKMDIVVSILIIILMWGIIGMLLHIGNLLKELIKQGKKK